MEFWWASLIVALLFVASNVLIFTVFKGKRELCRRTVFFCCIFILAYKVIYYTYMQIIGMGWTKFPVEYSALTYFLFTIVVLTRCEKLMPFAIFSAIVAGIAYNFSFIFSVNSFLPPDEPIFEYVFAWLNHSLLYFCGMLLLLYVYPLNKKLWWEIPVGVAVFAGYAAIMQNTVLKGLEMDTTIIYSIATGSLISYVNPALEGKWYFYIWYYPVLIGLLSGIALLMFKVNTAKKYIPQPQEEGVASDKTAEGERAEETPIAEDEETSPTAAETDLEDKKDEEIASEQPTEE